jgi:hypothetical protein
MAFDWKALLELARQLADASAEAGNPEAHLRSALSRAYFGAFCHARNYAQDFLNFAAQGKIDDHGALRAHLKGKRRKGDADRLERLRAWRNDADYEDDLSRLGDLAHVVQTALTLADRIFQSLIPPNK